METGEPRCRLQNRHAVHGRAHHGTVRRFGVAISTNGWGHAGDQGTELCIDQSFFAKIGLKYLRRLLRPIRWGP